MRVPVLSAGLSLLLIPVSLAQQGSAVTDQRGRAVPPPDSSTSSSAGTTIGRTSLPPLSDPTSRSTAAPRSTPVNPAPPSAAPSSERTTLVNPAFPPPAPLMAAPAYPGTLTPQTAVALAVARHPDIRGAEAVIARRQADLALAKADRWPVIQYGAGPGYGGAYGSGGNMMMVRGNIDVSQPVWDFGATEGRISAARELEASSRQKKADTAENVGQLTIAAYVDAAAAQERVVATREAIAAMRIVESRIVLRATAGLSNRSDVNTAGIAVRRTELEAEQARTLADSAMSRLIELIGVVPQHLEPLQKSYELFGKRDRGTPDFESAPAIKGAKNDLEAAAAREQTAWAEQFPAVSVGISRTLSTGPYSATDMTWGGITVKGNYGLGGGAQQKVAAAKADRRTAEQDLESKRLAARTAWQVAGREEEGARRRLANLNEVFSLWMATRDLYWQEYILDKRPLGDVINAEREIQSARTEQVAARGDAVAAAVKALVSQGGLVALLERQPGATGQTKVRKEETPPQAGQHR